MEILVLDTNFTAVGILDNYISFIWTDRYNKCGDFEIYTPSNKEVIELLKSDYYLWIKESNHVMIIEGYETKTDVEAGNTIIFTGRSLESILDRRVIWTQTHIDGNLQDGIKQLLDENLISPSDENRKISNFIFEASDDETITQLDLTAQYAGDNLYDVISSICSEYNLGFKITLNDNNQFVFKLYNGVDRSYNQDKNVYVVFSPDYENIINSDYLESFKNYKNVALVAGEGEGANRRTAIIGNEEGLQRRELFVDARGVSSTIDGGTLSDIEYNNQLIQKGEESISEYKTIKTFEGEMDTSQMYKFGEDYLVGDIIQIKNEFGIEAQARIIEFIFSVSASENISYPTFEIITDDIGNSGTSSGTLGSNGASNSTESSQSTGVYTKNEVDKYFAKKTEIEDFTKEEIDAICTLDI